jgi:hypothetical protein
VIPQYVDASLLICDLGVRESSVFVDSLAKFMPSRWFTRVFGTPLERKLL